MVRLLLAGMVAAVALVLAAPGGTVVVPTALPASVASIDRPVSSATYDTVDYGSGTARAATTDWRVVQGTGNCCENYLMAGPGGRLFDFGGSFINYSEDRGLTWHQVRPLTPLVNGEGAIVLSTTGDVIGIGWDPYSGDHLQAYKYDAVSGKWYYNELPVHSPFYDREWITVVPGPFDVSGETVPWIAFLKGGYPTKEQWFYSTDGLHYAGVTSKFLDELQTTPTSSYLTTKKLVNLDWIQPDIGTGLTPLGGGAALASGDLTSDWSLLDPSALSWSTFTFPGGVQPEGYYQVDSAGRIHDLVSNGTSLDYRLSSDGGRTWKTVTLQLPANDSVDQLDFKANKMAGVAAVAVHALNSQTGNDQDLVYKLDITKQQPRLLRMYYVGKGDIGSAAGVGNSIRMDFQSIAIFKDGRVAVSFLDSTTHYASPTTGQDQPRPAIAVEQSTTVGS
jgi:hypothetical protein